MGSSALTGKRVKASYLSTAVKDHLLFCVHTPSFDNFSILAYSQNNFILEIEESLLIMRDNPVLNKMIIRHDMYIVFIHLGG